MGARSLVLVAVLALACGPKPRSTPRASRVETPQGTLRLEGRVIDEDGRPVVGAIVTLVDTPKTAASTADGAFVFERLHPWTYRLVARHEDARSDLMLVHAREDAPVTVRVRRGLTLAIEVVDAETRTPIVGAIVSITGDRVTTGANGLAELRGLWGWFNAVRVAADRYLPVHLSGLLPFDPGGRYEQTVALRRGTAPPERPRPVAVEGRGTIRGVVVGADGAPVSDAHVVVSGARATKTDAHGRFAVERLFAGTYVLVGQRDKLSSAATRVTAPAKGVRLVLEPGMITGVVVDEKGASVPDVQVWSTPVDDRWHGGTLDATAVTDGAGRFVLGPLAAGEHHVRVAPSLWEHDLIARTASATARTGADDVRLIVPTTGEITGVVTKDGTPVPVFGYGISDFVPGLLSFSSSHVVRSATGRFTIRNVPAGVWFVAIFGEGFARMIVEGIVVESGKTTDLGTLTMQDGLTVRGRVVDAGGSPVPGALVEVGSSLFRPRGGDELVNPWEALHKGPRSARTDAKGIFVIDDVTPDRRLRAVASHGTAGRSSEVAVPTSGEVTITLQPTGTVVGHVTGGHAAVIVEVIGVDKHLGRASTVAGLSGEFRFEGLIPGRYRVRATRMRSSADPKRDRGTEVVVRAGKTVQIKVSSRPTSD